MDVDIRTYGGGYRPTASGSIGGRSFVFRMMSGRFVFAVGEEGESSVWWHSPAVELDYESGGTCAMAFHDDAVPLFLEQLEKYMRTLPLTEDVIAGLMREAEEQVWTKVD